MDKTGSERLSLTTKLPGSFVASITNTLMFHYKWDKALTHKWLMILTLVSNIFKSQKLHETTGVCTLLNYKA